MSVIFFFFNDPATTEIYTLSLHDALPIFSSALAIISSSRCGTSGFNCTTGRGARFRMASKRSEEHTSELQSHVNLVCRLLLEKKNNQSVTVANIFQAKTHFRFQNLLSPAI